jgi:hypothetical protein
MLLALGTIGKPLMSRGAHRVRFIMFRVGFLMFRPTVQKLLNIEHFVQWKLILIKTKNYKGISAHSWYFCESLQWVGFNEVIWKFSKLRYRRYWILSNLTTPGFKIKLLLLRWHSCNYFQGQQILDGSSIANFPSQWSVWAMTTPRSIHKGPFYFATVGTFAFSHFHNWLKYINWAMTKSHALETYVCLPTRIL